MSALEVGLTGEFQVTVTPAMTASAMGSGSVEVYATPSLIAAMEAAAVAAVKDHLKEGETSVGVYIDVQHISPSPVGAAISTKAEIIAVEDRHVVFTIEAHDDKGLIGKGTHRRTVVSISRFMEKVNKKTSS